MSASSAVAVKLAEHGRVLDQGTIGRGQPVDPGADEAAQRLGDGELVDLALEPEAVAVGDQATVVDEHPDGLDGEERDPVRSLDHLAHERPGQTRDDASSSARHRGVGEWLQVERAEVALAGAPRRAPFDELRAGQGDDQDPVVPAPFEDRFDEVDQPVVGPLEVLEDEDRQTLLGDPLDQPARRLRTA